MALDTEELEKSFRKLRKSLKALPRRPGVEHVHKLRTNSRRVESAIAAKSETPRKRERRLLKLIAAVRRRAGKVRDMDVLTSYADGLPTPDGERECKTLLLEHLGAMRKRGARKLFRKIKGNGNLLRRKLKRCESQSERHLQDGDRAAAVARRAASEALDISTELTNVGHLDRGNLHDFRLTVKRLQNVLQLANEQHAEQELISELKDTKDAIGEWHDWEMLAEIAVEVPKRHPRCKLMAEIHKIVRQRYQQAQRTALDLQEHRFKPGSRNRKTGRNGTVNRAAVTAAASLVA